jgi:tRNA-specific 2-thiouridylase
MNPKAIALLSGGLDSTLAVGTLSQAQMTLAEQYGIADYPCPAGGCLLTDPGLARRMRDLVRFCPDFDLSDVNLLKVGRHFRLSPGAKVVVGRNADENRRLQVLAREADFRFEVKGYGSPVTLLRGGADGREIHFAAAITARYSDAEGDRVLVHYGTDHAVLGEAILTSPLVDADLSRLRI